MKTKQAFNPYLPSYEYVPGCGTAYRRWKDLYLRFP